TIIAPDGAAAGILPVLRQVARDHFDDIRHGGNAGNTAVLIHDHGHVHACVLELVQQGDDGCAVEDNHRFDHAFRQIQGVAAHEYIQNVTGAYHSDQFIDFPAADEKARKAG